MSASIELILYACPTGELAVLLQQYFEASARACGANAAHAFPPHCTLTGFFHDQRRAVSFYAGALQRAVEQATSSQDRIGLRITSLYLMESFHFILLRSDGIKSLVRSFARTAMSPTRTEPLRTKEWLHLSLAYGFSPDHRGTLRRIAREHFGSIGSIPVSWEIVLYERAGSGRWIRHAVWSLS